MEFEENNVEIEGNSTRNLKKKTQGIFYSGKCFNVKCYLHGKNSGIRFDFIILRHDQKQLLMFI